MSVYTHLDRAELTEFLSGYSVGTLLAFEGIGEGVENSNYFVDTSEGRFVLTLVEQWSAEEMPFFLALKTWLADRGFPCARPVAARDGEVLKRLKGRPTAMVERLPGESLVNPGTEHRRAIGEALAEMHRKSADFPHFREDKRGESWQRMVAERLLGVLERDDAALLADELHYQSSLDLGGAPRGVIHADLFRDNVLFDNGHISGVIDFYYACNYALVYDLAVTLNDWATLEDGRLDPAGAGELLGAYADIRPLVEGERESLTGMMRRAALRFWLSRLNDKLYPRDGVMITVKDPDECKRILCHRRAENGNGATI
jgi:homoserine kinase type II